MSRTLLCTLLVAASGPLFAQAQDEDAAILERFQRLLNQKTDSSTRTSHKIGEAPAVLTVITAEEIEESGARTLADLLKRIPGVQVDDNRANVQMVWVRGVTTTYNEKVLLLVDGVPKRDATLGEWAPDERFDLTNVERIEIIRGPGSAVHGGAAYAAVISVYSKRQARETTVQVAGGNLDTAQGGFRTFVEGRGMEAIFTGRVFKTDGYESERGLNGGPTTNTNARASRNFQANLKVSDRTRVNLVYGQFNYLYPMHEWLSRRDATYTYTLGSISHTQQALGGEFHHQLNFDTTAISFYEVVRYQVPTLIDDPFGTGTKVTAPAGSIKQIKDQQKEGATLGFDTQGVWRLGIHQVLAGANIEHKKATYSELETNPNQTDPAKRYYYNSWFSQHGEAAGRNVARGTNYALFGQGELQIPPLHTRITLGIRWDHYQGFGGQFSPRIGLVAQPTADTTFKVLWGQAFRPPTFRQLYVMRFDGYQPADPNLKPERAQTLEAQITHNLGRTLTASLGYFQSTYRDTTLTIENSRWFNSPIPRKIAGFELELRAEFQPDLRWLHSISTFANAGYLTKARDETPLGPLDIASVAPRTANAGLTLRMPHVTLFTAWNYVGRRNAGFAYYPDQLNEDGTIKVHAHIKNTYHSRVTDPKYKAMDNLGAYGIQDLNLILRDFCPYPVRLEASVFNVWDRRHLSPTFDPDFYYDVLKERRAFQVRAVVTF